MATFGTPVRTLPTSDAAASAESASEERASVSQHSPGHPHPSAVFAPASEDARPEELALLLQDPAALRRAANGHPLGQAASEASEPSAPTTPAPPSRQR
jgi:hypothetical protein